MVYITIWQHHCTKVPKQYVFVRLTSSITCLVGVLHHSVQAKKERARKSLAQCHWVRAELHIDLCVCERNASVRKRCQWGTCVNYTSSCIVQHSNLKANVVETLFSDLEIFAWMESYALYLTIIKVTMKLRLTLVGFAVFLGLL